MTIEVHFIDRPIDVIIEECLIDVQVSDGPFDVIFGDEGPMGERGEQGDPGAPGQDGEASIPAVLDGGNF
jgi:hypothetical protein